MQFEHRVPPHPGPLPKEREPFFDRVGKLTKRWYESILSGFWVGVTVIKITIKIKIKTDRVSITNAQKGLTFLAGPFSMKKL